VASVIVIAIVYASGFALFYPEVFVSTDEAIYVEQASAFISGTGVSTPVSIYRPGTSILQMPFVAVGGWQAAALASLVTLAATAVLLARWLKDAGLPRIGESSRVCAGLLASLSLLFRETNAIIVVPFVAWAIWHRRDGWKPLAAGTCLGVLLVLGINQWIVGAPLALRDTAGWSITAPLETVPIYAFALLVLIPAGLAAVWMYQGLHRKETLAAIFLTSPLFTPDERARGRTSGCLTRRPWNDGRLPMSSRFGDPKRGRWPA
jgi:hypothetical protein